MFETNIENLRDPFIIKSGGIYYAYGTDVSNNNWDDTIWACYKNTSGRLDGEWVKTPKNVAVLPKDAVKNRWAPEVHYYKGSYYMFATYYSSRTNHRGCSILKSASPEGPFVEITNGHITPHEWDSIDATFYVDKEGAPWIIFVHEWTCTDDRIGRMAAARMSDDLTCLVSEPVELFRADSPSWSNKCVTDGCFMYQPQCGELWMIWSNFREKDYCVGMARSIDGRVDGEWIQDDELVFSCDMLGGRDGGHGMIFKDDDKKMYLVIHSPNIPTSESSEKTVIIPLYEKDNKLVCDL